MRGLYEVTAATPEHLPSLPQIERSAASLFGDDVPAQLLETVTSPPVFAAAQRSGLLWVALGPGDEPVGFARVESDGSRAHLAELDVLPAHGRRGVGTALVRQVEVWALSNDVVELTLTTYREFPWNAPFYARLGFTAVPESDLDTDLLLRFEREAGAASERSRRVVMRKRLCTAAANKGIADGKVG
jgi:GNAT superfamily N-acetyltransferase